MRWCVGLLLVCAAILKVVQAITEPALMHTTGRFYLPLQVCVELGVGMLALAGINWRQLRWTVLLLFAFFAAYSLYLAVSGAASCDCFGPIKVNPWWTFVLDIAVVLCLLFSVRHGREWNVKAIPGATQLVSYSAGRRTVIASVICVTAICTALLVWYCDHRMASAEGLLKLAGDLVVLEPDQWIGKPLPIARFINLDLSNGKWIVLLHRHDCPICQEEVPRYEQLGRQVFDRHVALVEVPPYGNFDASVSNVCHHARLKDDYEWFVQTPVEIQLQDGIVKATKSHGG